MRGCLLLLVGVGIGVAIMLAGWPRIPGATPLPASSDMHVHLTDGYLARVVQRRANGVDGLSVHAVTMASQPPQILVMHAQVGVGPVSVPVAVELRPNASGGAPQIDIVQAQLAGIPVPSVFTGLVVRSINASMRRVVPARASVSGVSVTPDGVDLTANFR